jgi:hypothetical protein
MMKILFDLVKIGYNTLIFLVLESSVLLCLLYIKGWIM